MKARRIRAQNLSPISSLESRQPHSSRHQLLPRQDLWLLHELLPQDLSVLLSMQVQLGTQERVRLRVLPISLLSSVARVEVLPWRAWRIWWMIISLETSRSPSGEVWREQLYEDDILLLYEGELLCSERMEVVIQIVVQIVDQMHQKQARVTSSTRCRVRVYFVSRYRW